jgi:hypothetical protein
MTTDEHEITQRTFLADSAGKLLNEAAKGWSRTPQHVANLKGVFGRTKRWDYWAIFAGDLVISGVYADVDYLGNTDVMWCDVSTGKTGGRGHTSLGSGKIQLPDVSGEQPLKFESPHFSIEMHDDHQGNTHIMGSWVERDGVAGKLSCVIELPAGHESLSVVIPWSKKRFQFTTKHQARPARGELTVGDRSWEFGNDSDAWGVVDIGRGRWPYGTQWNWGGGAGRTRSGTVVGLQFGGKWTAGTGYTENGLLIDGRLHKIGRELLWDYEWDDPMKPWSVSDTQGQVDLVFTPRYDKYDKLDLKILRRETHLMFGTWTGHVIDDRGVRHEVKDFQGFAEESRARW